MGVHHFRGTMVRVHVAMTTAAPTLAAALSTSIPLVCSALGRSSIVASSAARCQHAARMTASFSTSAEQPNHLLSIPATGQDGSLRNSYSALRHGQSLANVAKIISSDPAISTVEHGLSDFGHEQAREAGKLFAEQFHADNENVDNGSEKYCGVAIFSSDFKRARETAQHIADACKSSSIPLYKDGVVLETKLRERNFGTLNGGSDNRYQDVWNVDIKDPTHNEFGVESVYSVVERTTKLVLDIDEELTNASQGEKKYKCILVAHGDVLQILQTGFKKMDGSLHRTLPHLETATVRELNVAEAPLCGYHAVE